MIRALITGTNRGIGLEICRQLQARGEDVTAVCRSDSAPLNELGVKTIQGIDVADGESLQRLTEAVKGEQFDWLVNNAGVLSREGLSDLDFDAIERQFRINSIGPLRVSHALLGNLSQGSKIGIVTSRMGSVDDNTSGGYYGYRMSKAAVNMAGKSLSHDLQEQGISVALLHPGMVATDMTGHSGVSVSHAASGLISRMDELNMDNSGSFWHAEGQILPW